MLLGNLKDALDRGDAEYFKRLSVAIESFRGTPVDRVRTNLFMWLFDYPVSEGQYTLFRPLTDCRKCSRRVELELTGTSFADVRR